MALNTRTRTFNAIQKSNENKRRLIDLIFIMCFYPRLATLHRIVPSSVTHQQFLRGRILHGSWLARGVLGSGRWIVPGVSIGVEICTPKDPPDASAHTRLWCRGKDGWSVTEADFCVVWVDINIFFTSFRPTSSKSTSFLTTVFDAVERRNGGVLRTDVDADGIQREGPGEK